MEKLDLNTWDQFPDAIKEVHNKFGKYEFDNKIFENKILYRGQADAIWPLKTTLERFTSRKQHIWGYLNIICSCAPQIESYTGRSWNIPDWPDVEKALRTSAKKRFNSIPLYDFMVHLRHLGFPSPLLDWTESPYIAAFFAFEEIPEKADRVSVMAYIETPFGSKSNVGKIPEIVVEGPYVRTHKRHFLQQAWYTIAIEMKAQNGWHYFVPHESITNKDFIPQDIMVKITIPKSERSKVLRCLYDYNITRFSLFQNEETLVHTLAYKEIEMNDL